MNLLATINADVSSRLILVLAHFLWQGVVLAAAGALVAWALRHSPAAKYRVYLATLALMAMGPAVTWLTLAPAAGEKRSPSSSPIVAAAVKDAPAVAVGTSQVRSSPPQPQTTSTSPIADTPAAITATPAELAPLATQQPPIASSAQVADATPSQSWKRFAPHLASVYLIGVCLMFVRVLFGLRGARRLCRRSDPIDEPALLAVVERLCRRLGLAAAPRVRKCRDVVVPTVAGIVRPVILLPLGALAGLRPDEVESILAHELAHIRRRDHLVLLAQRGVEAVLFFHPAVWFISRRLETEREHCCDDAVVRAVGRPIAYARSLVRVAELCLEGRASSGIAGARLSLAAVDSAAPLRRRVLRLLEGGGTPRLRLARVWVVAVVMAVSLLATTAWMNRGSSAAAAEEPKPLTELTGILTDPTGRPVSNAYITTDAENPWYGVRSDVSGKFTLKNLKPTVHRAVAFSQRSGRMAMFDLPATAPKEPLAVKLDYAEMNADGRVVDASGNPVKGAFVRLFLTTKAGEMFHFPTYGKTDNSGYYSTGLIPSAPGLSLHATLSDDPNDVNHTEPLALTGGPQAELPDLVVRTATAPSPKPGPQRVRYSGRALDESGKPIVGAEIELDFPKNHMNSGGGKAMTDAEGRFSRLLPPDAERVRVSVNHPEYLGSQFDDVTQPAASALRDGSAVITLKRGLPLEGVVKDDAGRPLSNALVMTNGWHSMTPGPENEPIEDSTSPRTDAAGHFRVPSLPEAPREVVVLTDTFAPLIVPIEVKSGMAPLELKLQRGIRYSGRVVDLNGKPLVGASVGCNDWKAGLGQSRPLVRFTKTDADGQFTLDAMPLLGTVSISASAGKQGYLSNGFEWSSRERNRDTITLFKPAIITGVVRDAETDKPVTEFQVRPGWYANKGDQFDESDFDGVAKVKSAEGKFSKKIERISLGGGEPPAFAAKIVARGYLPQMTPNVYLGKPYEPFVIRLKKGAPIAGVVTDPAGAPARGAKAIFVGPHDVTYVDGLAINDNLSFAPRIRTKTDAKGAFELPATAEAGRVLVLHESGYAIRPSTELSEVNPAPVKLTPWARVEGDLIIGNQSLNGQAISLEPVRDERTSPDRPKEIYFELNTATRADGKFAFERVPSQPMTLVRNTDNGPSGGVSVEAKGGQTVTVHLGDQRRAAAGKIDIAAVVPDAAKVIRDAARQVRVRAFRVDPAPVAPAGLADHAAWDAAVAAARTAEPGIDTPLSSFAANVAATMLDGAIRFTDLLPGHYVMYADVHAAQDANVCGWGRVLASARVEFDVPPASTADTAPVALPAIPLVSHAYPNVGDTAPPIEAKTTAGGAFALEKLRGKVVLIDFWGSWCAPCMAAMPEMKKLHERYAKDDRVVFVGGNFDWDAKAAEQAMAELKLPWEQLALGSLTFEHPISRAYGISAIPSTWIISVDGKVLAKDLHGVGDVSAALEKALAGEVTGQRSRPSGGVTAMERSSPR